MSANKLDDKTLFQMIITELENKSDGTYFDVLLGTYVIQDLDENNIEDCLQKYGDDFAYTAVFKFPYDLYLASEKPRYERYFGQIISVDANNFVDIFSEDNIDIYALAVNPKVVTEEEDDIGDIYILTHDIDVGDRDTACIYVNGLVFESRTHAQCINLYRDHMEQEHLEDDFGRPDQEEFLDPEEISEFAVASKADGCLFIEDWSLIGISKLEVSKIFRAELDDIERVYDVSGDLLALRIAKCHSKKVK